MVRRSDDRTTLPPTPSWAAAKNSPSVTPSASAILSIELIDGEARPFSTWEMKLGEKSVRVARVRSEIPAAVRRRRIRSPTACCLRSPAGRRSAILDKMFR
jgi:hypothetical protein